MNGPRRLTDHLVHQPGGTAGMAARRSAIVLLVGLTLAGMAAVRWQVIPGAGGTSSFDQPAHSLPAPLEPPPPVYEQILQDGDGRTSHFNNPFVYGD